MLQQAKTARYARQRNRPLPVLAQVRRTVTCNLSNLNMPSHRMLQLVMDLDQKTDGELLMLVAQRHDSSEMAFRTFYKRHVGYLLYICNRKYGDILTDTGVEDLVQETFTRVYEKAHTFCADKALNHDDSLKRTHGWLQRIAANLFHDYRRRNTNVPTEPLMDTHVILTESNSQNSEDSEKMKLIKDALNRLTEREQDILRTAYQWREPNRHLPSHVIEELTQRYNTTPENIRKILSRTIKKVKDFIEENSSNKNSS